jgi:hypothetical protein
VNVLCRVVCVGMGFGQIRSEKALILSGGKSASLESAIEWLSAHGEDADIDEPLQVVATKPKAGGPTPMGEWAVCNCAVLCSAVCGGHELWLKWWWWVGVSR